MFEFGARRGQDYKVEEELVRNDTVTKLLLILVLLRKRFDLRLVDFESEDLSELPNFKFPALVAVKLFEETHKVGRMRRYGSDCVIDLGAHIRLKGCARALCIVCYVRSVIIQT